MKNIFKKGLVVLLASLFVTSVFAATEATTAQAAKPVATAHTVVKHHVDCKKVHCVKNKAGKKVCKKACKVKHVVKKAQAATPAKKA